MPNQDDLITNIMLYWLNNTIRSSIRYYNEGMGGDWNDGEDWGDEATDWGMSEDTDDSGDSREAAPTDDDGSGSGADWQTKIEVPTAIAIFPNDIVQPPRELAERFFTIERFTAMEHGGHFAALEVPELLEGDIRSFFRSF
ncbi:alpha/beta fold hydrolase [Halocatena marina]|uniref:Alpha/beta fold hydrolase n=2 Tax=Halocatena marina TaxID=2934937 RepID=A0ABD5YTJ6_9EURY